jgi:4-hydroxy-4-methyl-2-oxoglutarate aldolase
VAPATTAWSITQPEFTDTEDKQMNACSPRVPSEEQIEILKRLGTATVHEAQGQTGALTPAIKPIDPRRRLAGPALTIDVPPGDNLIIHFALTQAQVGDVLVVNAHGYIHCAVWGDILTVAAQHVGVQGVVIDGAVRDTEAIIDSSFPVFARGVSIQGPQKSQYGRINVPIVCGEMPVKPGDIVVGDRDGVVVIPQSALDQVIIAALKREAAEVALRENIRAGRSTVDLLHLSSELAHHGIGASLLHGDAFPGRIINPTKP